MTDPEDGEHVSPAVTRLPIVTASDGQPYMPCDAVVAYLRAVADSWRNLAGDPECDLETAAAAIDQEADALECAAIERTSRPPGLTS